MAKQVDNVTEQADSAAEQIDSAAKQACRKANQGCSLKKPVRRTAELLSCVPRRTNYFIKEAAHHSLLSNFTAKTIDRPMGTLEKKIENLSDPRLPTTGNQLSSADERGWTQI